MKLEFIIIIIKKRREILISSQNHSHIYRRYETGKKILRSVKAFAVQ